MQVKNKISILFIPLFLFIVLFFSASTTVNAAPTAPTSVNLTFQKDGAVVTKVARNSTITLTAQANGGSSSSGHYEYSFSVKTPGSTTWSQLRAFGTANTFNYNLTESGSYAFRVMAHFTDSTGSSSPVSVEKTITSVGVTNTSTISKTSIELGESVTINASATGGNGYEYYYSVSKDGGTNYSPISPSTNESKYVIGASCSYKPSAVGNYKLRVFTRDKETGAEAQKVFDVSTSAPAIVNQCDVNSSKIEISSKGAGITLNFKADKGTAPYKYRCSFTIPGTVDTPEYVYGDSENFTSGKTSVQYVFKKIGIYKFKFEVQDSSTPPKTSTVTKTVEVTTKMENVSTTFSDKVSYKSDTSFNFAATGGTGEYEYKLTYKIDDDSSEVNYSNYQDSAVLTVSIPNILSKQHLDSDYTGTILFKTVARDKNIGVVRERKFTINIVEPSAAPTSRQDLMNLMNDVKQWEYSLSKFNRDVTIPNNARYYITARDKAQDAIDSDVEQDYGEYYDYLKKAWEKARKDIAIYGASNFWMTDEVNNAYAFENALFRNIERWFISFSDSNVKADTFEFDIEAFVDMFSPIFVIFASSLLVLLFGISIIKSAYEYQLFTLKGFVSVIARLFLAELWIQLSTKICIMVIKIFSELMESIISEINKSGIGDNTKIQFKASRSDVWLVGDIIDFFANLMPFLLAMILIGVLMILFAIIYVKLIVRTLEIAMMSVISPVFFACSVGEATMPYFKKFISSFLLVTAEIIFMGLVYLAFLWYAAQNTGDGAIEMSKLYDVTSFEAGKFYTYVAVSVACGVMMIRPPQVLRDLFR